jgi:CHASE3 domain sensor protein
MRGSSLSSSSTGRLVGLLLAAILALAGIGAMAAEWALREGTRSLESAVESSSLLDRARKAQVQFKVQVQDWKNLLLRGHDAKDRESYLARFGADEAEVQRLLGEVVASPTLPVEVRDEVSAIAEEHRRLGVGYREGFGRFRADDFASTFAVDASVRGIDQKLAKRLDDVADRILEGARTQEQVLVERVALTSVRIRRALALATLAVTALLGLLLWRALAAPR